MPIRVLRNVHLPLIALAVSALTANAQVGEADKCVKVHQTRCSKSASGHYTGVYVQNTCSKDIMVFLRINYHNAYHPQIMRYEKTNQGEPWGNKSVVFHYMPSKEPPKPWFSGTIPCWKKFHYAYCAEYRPDDILKHKNHSKNVDEYIRDILPKSVCYQESTEDPFETREGVAFHPLTSFYVRLYRFSRLMQLGTGMNAGRRYGGHPANKRRLSHLPKPAGN